MKRVIILLFVTVVTLSCSTPKKQNARSIEIHDIEDLPLGVSTQRIIQAFGEPSEKREDAAKDKNVNWVYREPNGYQRVSLEIDQTTETLIGKAVIIRSDEPEAKIDFLLNRKFKTYRFQKVSRPRCDRDYEASESMLVDPSRGISIIFREKSGDVEVIDWTSSNRVQNGIDRTKSCKKR